MEEMESGLWGVLSPELWRVYQRFIGRKCLTTGSNPPFGELADCDEGAHTNKPSPRRDCRRRPLIGPSFSTMSNYSLVAERNGVIYQALTAGRVLGF